MQLHRNIGSLPSSRTCALHWRQHHLIAFSPRGAKWWRCTVYVARATSLADGDARLPCALLRPNAARTDFWVTLGQEVEVTGQAERFRGQWQLYVVEARLIDRAALLDVYAALETALPDRLFTTQGQVVAVHRVRSSCYFTLAPSACPERSQRAESKGSRGGGGWRCSTAVCAAAAQRGAYGLLGDGRAGDRSDWSRGAVQGTVAVVRSGSSTGARRPGLASSLLSLSFCQAGRGGV